MNPTKPKNRTNQIGLAVVVLLLGSWGLYKVGTWVKHRWSDPDRMVVGVHGIDDEDAIVMYRYDGDDDLQWHLARVELETDTIKWQVETELPLTASTGNGMSVAGGFAVVLRGGYGPSGSVAAYDLQTGEQTWIRNFRQRDGDSPKITGTPAFVIIDANDFVHVLDRTTGKTLLERKDSQHRNFAFTDRWIHFEGLSTMTFFDVASGQSTDVEDFDGEFCRVGDVLYGIRRKAGLVSHDLRTGTQTVLVEGTTRNGDSMVADLYPQSCGWRRSRDRLRLVLSSRGDDAVTLLAYDVVGEDAELAWSVSHPASYADFGVIGYDVSNRLELVWFGEMPRYGPLEIGLSDAPDDADQQIVVVDVEEGRVLAEGTPGDRSFMAFKRGDDIVIRSAERFEADARSGFLLTVDGETGEVLGALEQETIWIEPTSIAGETYWAWKNTSFSRQRDMAIITADRTLQVQTIGDPQRVPKANTSIGAELLGL